jgi:uncharacterized membrane protein
MPLNLHPVLVHFPIALLTLYCLLEISRLRMSHVKRFLLLVGAASAVVTRQSGEMIGDSFRAITSLTPVVDLHATVATITTILFCVMALAHAMVWLQDSATFPRISSMKLFGWLAPAARYMSVGWLAVVLAIVGLALITLTGTLGGIIAFGPNVDPATSLVYRLFFQ